ncbi:hypothetical protein GBA52_006206 [Prunus armeniaca]|nr:hypothetical protein GBA52_006206 [Prunus armeniaca]
MGEKNRREAHHLPCSCILRVRVNGKQKQLIGTNGSGRLLKKLHQKVATGSENLNIYKFPKNLRKVKDSIQLSCCLNWTLPSRQLCPCSY